MVLGEGGKLGRATFALKLAHDLEAYELIFGTGASKVSSSGQLECEYTLQWLRWWLATNGSEYYAPKELGALKRLAKEVFLDRQSQNTTEEVQNALRRCHDLGANTLWLVSSPAHMPRCLNEAMKLDHKGVRIIAAPSMTSGGNFTPENNVIIEHPHRGDDTSPYLGAHVRRMFKVPAAKRSSMLKDLDLLLSKYGA